jgi:hypothetical protein
MRRAVIVLMTMGLLAAGVAQAVTAQSAGPTQSEQPTQSAGPTGAVGVTQRVEVPEAGIAMSFPADWTIRIPMSGRVSDVPANPDATEPACETTLIWALGDDGRWCDVDMYEGTGLTLEEHAAWLQAKLQAVFKVDRFLATTSVELPFGTAIRIDMDDAVRDRTWRMYLFERGAEHYLLSCADQLHSEDDWMSVAETIELLPS